jgi:NTP pyrophosphatase (non-canonical NTP hydrolase)
MSDIEDLQNKVVAFRDERNWKQFHNPKDMALSLVLEAAELLEHFQWKNNEEFKAHYAKNKNDVDDEIMDILYWVLLIANDLKVDIPKEFDRKMQKNISKYPKNKSSNSHKKYTEL